MSMNKTDLTAGRIGLAAAFAAAAFAAAPAAQAQVVSKDIAGAQLRAPSIDEAQALSAGKSATASRGLITGKVSPRAVTRRDGSVEQELDESSLVYMVVTRNADGTLSDVCVTGPDAANAVVNGKQAIAKNSSSTKEHRHDAK